MMKLAINKILLPITIALLTLVTATAQDYSDYDGCAEQDSLALVAFFNATDGPNWKSQQDGFSVDDLGDDVKTYYTTTYPNAGMGKWLEGPVKDWFGVLLEKQQVGNSTDSIWRVIHLRATIDRRSSGDNNLSGYIPKEVGLLTALKWFKVNGNAGLKNTEIPDEIYHSTLEQFDIESVYFKGNISSSFRNCTNLSYINLRYNYIDSIPTLNFLPEQHLLDSFASTGQTIWFYNTQISYATLEPTIAYFLSVSEDIEYEARNLDNVGRKKEVILTQGGSVTLTSSDAGDEGTYTWYKNGSNTYSTGNTYTTSDTGSYKVLLGNTYIQNHDENQDYTNSFTKSIHVVHAPVPPECTQATTSNSGLEVALTFDKPMAIPDSAQCGYFTVTADSRTINPVNIERGGWVDQKLVLTLEEPLENGNTVNVAYTAGDVTCANGGALASFSGLEADNHTRTVPSITRATTSIDGESIILTFENFIDESSLDGNDFSVSIEGIGELVIDEAALVEGDYDASISKKVELFLGDYLDDDQTITVSYTRGSLTALYGAMPESFSDYPVVNVVDALRMGYTFKVIDGTQNIQKIVVDGDMKSRRIELFDDGTNGDAVSDDHIWTRTSEAPLGTYGWDVYARTYDYDTLVSNDTIKLVIDKDAYTDTIINSGIPLSITIDSNEVSGDSLFEYYNYTVTFILDIYEYLQDNAEESAAPYLMGIDEDWTTGIEMDALINDSVYMAQITQRNTGEELSFNFRNGEIWETNSPAYRTYTVEGNDTIYNSFGYYVATTSAQDIQDEAALTVYPNPATTYLWMKLSNGTIGQIKIYNLMGKCVTMLQNSTYKVDITALEPGSYIIEAQTSQGKTFRHQFIKL